MDEIKFGFTAKTVIDENRITQKDIDVIKSWLSEQKFPNLTDEQIILFQIACRNKEEDTKKTIKEYYHYTKNYPQIFNGRNVANEELKKQLTTLEYCVLSKKSSDGCAILCVRLSDGYYGNYDMANSIKLLFMTLQAATYNYPPEGFIILYDMNLVGLMHLTKVRLQMVKLYCEYLQKALAGKLKCVHVFNTVSFLNKVMAILDPFIDERVKKRLHFHPANVDMEVFYKDHLPKSCLPKDYGGDLPSISELHKQTVEKLIEMQDFFDAEEVQRCDRKYF